MLEPTIVNADAVAASPHAIEAVRALARLSRRIERASGELSLAHYRLLSGIAAGNERASRLAAKLSLGKPTVSESVDALCRRGLVTRSSVGSDQRVVALALTGEGREVLDRVEKALIAELSELCALTGDGLAAIDALAALGTALEVADVERNGGGADDGTPGARVAARIALP